MDRRRRIILLALLAVLAACDNGSTQQGVPVLSMWSHSGRAEERETIARLVRQFKDENPDLRVELNIIPEGSYNGQVQGAALAGDLPDILELDGPYVASYAWRGYIASVDELIDDDLRQDLLPSIVAQGTYHGRLYALGMFDSGLGLYGRRSALEAAGARVPTSPEDAWTADELENLLRALAARDDDGAVLDLKLNYRGEWYAYAFSPAIQSAGGDLVGRGPHGHSRQVLDGLDAIGVMRRFQRWLSQGLVDPNLDDRAFISGRVALSWVGHWEYQRYQENLGDDLVVLPLPDFGHGGRTGQGSWVWAVTTACDRPELAARFIAFLLGSDQIGAMTRANGAVPATRTALARSALYGADGPLRLFADQLIGGWSVPRPETPAYPVISSVFEQVFQQVRDGADVSETLHHAAAVIDREIDDNHGYPGR